MTNKILSYKQKVKPVNIFGYYSEQRSVLTDLYNLSELTCFHNHDQNMFEEWDYPFTPVKRWAWHEA
jgi:hypothetical protein